MEERMRGKETKRSSNSVSSQRKETRATTIRESKNKGLSILVTIKYFVLFTRKNKDSDAIVSRGTRRLK